MAKIFRDQVLQEKPGFLSQNEVQQITRLEKELEVSQKQLDSFKASDVTEEAPKDVLSEVAGTKIGKLLSELL